MLKSQFPQPKGYAFRKHFIKIADDISGRRQKQFSTRHYKNGIRCALLSLEEGFTLKTSYLVYVLHNTKVKLGKYVVYTHEMKSGKAEDYTATIPIGIDYIVIFDINISIPVFDGNKALLKALRELKKSKKSIKMVNNLIIIHSLKRRIKST